MESFDANLTTNLKYFSNPVHTNGGQSVADAFMRIYGVEIKKASALKGLCLKVSHQRRASQ